MRRAGALALALALVGCGGLAPPPAPASPAAAACPAVNAYPPELERRLLDELDALPPDAALRTFVIDAIELRDEVRAARGEPIPYGRQE